MQSSTRVSSFFQLKSDLYSGHCGYLSKPGNILHVQAKCIELGTQAPACRVLFVVDRSGSMEKSMLDVVLSVESLLARMEEDLRVDGSLIREVGVLAFADKVDVVVPMGLLKLDNFELIRSDIRRITAAGSTNLKVALQRAMDTLNDANERASIPTYLVVLTDGKPNEGSIKTDKDCASFLGKHLMPWCHTFSLGFGTEYDPFLLKALGQYVHVPDKETVPEIMGSMYPVIVQGSIMKAELTTNRTYVDSIYSSSLQKDSEIYKIPLGLLFSGKTFEFLISVYDLQLQSLSFTLTGWKYNQELLKMAPFERTYTINFKIGEAGAINSEIRRIYFEALTANLCSEAMSTEKPDEVRIKLNEVVKEWNGMDVAMAKEYVENLEKVAGSILDINAKRPARYESSVMTSLSQTIESAHQSSLSGNKYITTAQVTGAKYAKDYVKSCYDS